MRSIITFMIYCCCSSITATNISETLPVIYIDTQDGKPIIDKENYIAATYYIDTKGIVGLEPIGTPEHPEKMEIKGRGNFTWGYFNKKPYKIKLTTKKSLLGISSNKHFALLAHADNDYAFFRNTVAFEISRRIGMPFTPEQRPIEVVLNGEYKGLYMLTETIRVDKKRVNITQQADNEQSADAITGGWLVEIDNNKDNSQIDISVDGTDLEWLWITYHDPEVLSTEQADYLSSQFELIKQLIYTADKSSKEWEKMIDITSLAKYYIIHETVDQLEGFLGSCYLYKDLGETKWHFGPVWDFGNAFNDYHAKDKFIYEDAPFPVSMIKEIAKFPRFQEEVKRLWNEYYDVLFKYIDTYINDFADEIAMAAANDYQCWPEYGDKNVKKSAEEVINCLHQKVSWLHSQWSSAENSISVAMNHQGSVSRFYDFSGHIVKRPKMKGFYIQQEYQSDGSLKVKKIKYDGHHL